MPVLLTKSAIKEIELKQRKTMRLKHKQSAFMKKTLSIYNGLKKRGTVNFTVDDLRKIIRTAIDKGTCPYCEGKLTIAKLAVDHGIAIAQGGKNLKKNLVPCCQTCNWRKGILSSREFDRLVRFANRKLSVESREDLWRRLVLGGKWSFGR